MNAVDGRLVEMLYGSRASGQGVPVMATKGANDTDPIGTAPVSTTAGDERRPKDVTEPDARPALTYEPPTDNPEMLELLGNLKPRRAPPPVNMPVTDGDLAAAYAAGERPPPEAHPTPTPQPPVIVEVSPPPPRRQVTLRMGGVVNRNAPTVRIDRPVVAPDDSRGQRRAMLIGVTIGAASMAVVSIVIAIVVTASPKAATAPSPSATPFGVPPPPNTTPVPTVAATTAQPASAPPSTPSAVPADAARVAPSAPVQTNAASPATPPPGSTTTTPPRSKAPRPKPSGPPASDPGDLIIRE